MEKYLHNLALLSNHNQSLAPSFDVSLLCTVMSGEAASLIFTLDGVHFALLTQWHVYLINHMKLEII